MRLFLALNIALLALAWSSLLQAHEREEDHRVITTARLSEKGAHVDALLMMQVPEGERAKKLLAQYDLNRSGKIDGVESQALGARLGAEAVNGYVLRYGDRSLQPRDLKVSATITEAGGILLYYLFSYDLPALDPNAKLAVHVLKKPGGNSPVPSMPFAVEMQAAAPLKITASSVPLAPDAPVTVPSMVSPGGAAAWIVLKKP